ncbi:hypothetical protein SPOG_02698 [Schizosaccharomyces cryophilus OY26]|uniref:Uncharacterized protein n=1 Tax=Schizosaccharomyces cryophilus (strain OY26 / ATCC MYA-4695 / CBS 11777 / NBRC 106824 / NRRL Y48691) TaxID=653667 RepID=S9X345_SCHCR|nr:uncharacterized protein SPOG_02698 [Schizosaccharomyces cryophilus OY26]EPY51527.1 hypothetical protein SPOG_02698 [Schizosaccharomyces cryophilus OY26]
MKKLKFLKKNLIKKGIIFVDSDVNNTNIMKHVTCLYDFKVTIAVANFAFSTPLLLNRCIFFKFLSKCRNSRILIKVSNVDLEKGLPLDNPKV